MSARSSTPARRRTATPLLVRAYKLAEALEHLADRGPSRQGRGGLPRPSVGRSRPSGWPVCPRPRSLRESMIPTRSAKTSASSRYWVVRKIVMPSSLTSRATLLPERGPALWIKPGRRLVEEQHPRPVDQGEREIEPALHPARVAANGSVGGLDQPDPLEQLGATRLALRFRDPLEGRLEVHVLPGVEMRVQGRGLEGHADRGSDLWTLVGDVETPRRARCPRSAAATSSASRRSSTCRHHSARGSRRSPPDSRRGLFRRRHGGSRSP